MITNTLKLQRLMYVFLVLMFVFGLTEVNSYVDAFEMQYLSLVFDVFITVFQVSLPLIILILFTDIFSDSTFDAYMPLMLAYFLLFAFINSDLAIYKLNVDSFSLDYTTSENSFLYSIFTFIVIARVAALLNDNFKFEAKNGFRSTMYLVMFIVIMSVIFFVIYMTFIDFLTTSIFINNIILNLPDQVLALIYNFGESLGVIFSNIFTLRNDLFLNLFADNIEACTYLSATDCLRSTINYSNVFLNNSILIPIACYFIIRKLNKDGISQFNKLLVIAAVISFIFGLNELFYLFLFFSSIELLILFALLQLINVLVLPPLHAEIFYDALSQLEIFLKMPTRLTIDQIIVLFMFALSEIFIIYLFIEPLSVFKLKVPILEEEVSSNIQYGDLTDIEYDLNRLFLMIPLDYVKRISFYEYTHIELIDGVNPLFNMNNFFTFDVRITEENEIILESTTEYNARIYKECCLKHYVHKHGKFKNDAPISEQIN